MSNKIALQPRDIQFRTISYQSKPLQNNDRNQNGLTMMITDTEDIFGKGLFNSFTNNTQQNQKRGDANMMIFTEADN